MPTLVLPRFLLPFAAIMLTACPSGGETTEPTPTPSAVYAATGIAGASQTKTVGAASDAMTVRITKDGEALPNATVTWTTSAGTLAAASTTTSSSGESTNALTNVGANAGNVTVTASSNGKSASFTITVSAAPPGPPASIALTSRYALLDSAGNTTATAVVKDANGTTLSNATVTWTSRATANATVSSTGQIAGVKSGQATIVASVTSGSTTFSDSLLAVVGRPDGPIVMVELPRLDLKADTTFTVAVIADMRASTTKLGSGKVTITWPTTLLTYQGHAEGATNVGATVNATETGTGKLTLAFANSGGYSGKVELRRITFKASSTITSGTVAATANETYAAGTYADLIAKTLSIGLNAKTR